MAIVPLIILIVVVVVAFWLIDYVPWPGPLNMILKVMVGLFALLKLFGMLGITTGAFHL
jgi:hypothetical protein